MVTNFCLYTYLTETQQMGIRIAKETTTKGDEEDSSSKWKRAHSECT